MTKKNLHKARIEPFAPILSPLIKESLVEVGQDRYRQGTLLIPVLVVWLVLGLTMRRDLNLYQVMEWMIASYRWATMMLPAELLCAGAISHARMRVGVEVFRVLFVKLGQHFESVAPDFHHYVTVVFDGVVLNMPDTPSNCTAFSKPSNNRGCAGFPMMRVVTLMAASVRLHLDVAFAPYKGKGTGERSLATQIVQRCTLENLLFLFDAGFYSSAFITMLKKHDYIMKVSKTVNLKPITGSYLSDGSYLVEVSGITIRVINVEIKGFRPFRLVTSLLDPRITALEIVTHYHKRWGIEISYDEIKTHQCATLRGQAPTILRSKRSELIEQELYALLISYNMTRCLMYQSANEHEMKPLEFSFLDCMQWIIDAVDKSKCHIYLSYLISESTIDRPCRKRMNPRVIKIKMSKFKKKRDGDEGRQIDYEKITQIISYEEFEKAS